MKLMSVLVICLGICGCRQPQACYTVVVRNASTQMLCRVGVEWGDQDQCMMGVISAGSGKSESFVSTPQGAVIVNWASEGGQESSVDMTGPVNMIQERTGKFLFIVSPSNTVNLEFEARNGK